MAAQGRHVTSEGPTARADTTREVVHERYGDANALDQAPAAMRRREAGNARGKVALTS